MDLIDLKNMPLTNPDYVSRAVVEQIIWERDTAIGQLRQLGYEFGEKIRTDGDLISRQAAVYAIDAICSPESCKSFLDKGSNDCEVCQVDACIKALDTIPSAQPTLNGYDIRHLELIASVMQKENLPPERVTEALTDIGRIIEIITDEFEETLRKAVEQCTI